MKIENEKQVQVVKDSSESRRGFFAAAAIAALGAVTLGSKKAYASIAGEENGPLLAILAQVTQQNSISRVDQSNFEDYQKDFDKLAEVENETKKLVSEDLKIQSYYKAQSDQVEAVLGALAKGPADWAKFALRNVNDPEIDYIAQRSKKTVERLDEIDSSMKEVVKINGLEKPPAQTFSVRMRKRVALDTMKSEAAMVAASQRKTAVDEASRAATNNESKFVVQQASSVVSQEQLMNQLLKQQILTNELLMSIFESILHGRPLQMQENLNKAEFARVWTSIESEGDFNGSLKSHKAAKPQINPVV